VAIFLVVAHIAMIFGMLNPSILSSKTDHDLSSKVMNMEM
jgi:hypothetical protein